MSRQSKDDVSPLGSPSFGSPSAVFKQSPVSTPITPSYQTSPRESDSSSHDPIKMPVILPDVPSSSNPTYSSLPVTKPPPLPPKPRVSSHPPLPPYPPSMARDNSPPPPPIPPRLVTNSSGRQPATPSPASFSHTPSHRSPLESRPPLMDPVFPTHSAILPRHHRHNGQSLDTPPPVSSLSSSPLSRPPSSLPHSASWLPPSTHSHNGHMPPLSAGPEIGSHFTFGNHVLPPTGSGHVPHVSPQLPPRPNRTTSTPR